jgi:hypothetical protein
MTELRRRAVGLPMTASPPSFPATFRALRYSFEYDLISVFSAYMIRTNQLLQKPDVSVGAAEAMKEHEKRKFTRIPFRTEIKITAEKRVVFSNELSNISLGGAYVETTDEGLPIGEPCVFLIDLVGPASLLRVRVEGEIVRSDEKGIGVTFTQMDLDSLVHLKHLIKVHAQDPDLIDHEFLEHLVELQ